MPTWPITLPQRPLQGGSVEQPPDTLLETQMDVGPPKARRRFTAGVRPIDASMVITAAQVQTLDDFYVTTLQGGALTFDYVHPRTGVAGVYRMTRPSYQHISRDTYRARFQFRLQP